MSIKKSLNNLDKASDRASNIRVNVTELRYNIYLLLLKGRAGQTQVANTLNLRRQTINYHVKQLEILGLIEPIDPNGNPKFYKPTSITPVVSKYSTPVVSKSAKRKERSVCKTPILVRDISSGKIKNWKSGRKIGLIRDYNTIVSEDGRRIPMIRAHSLSFICTILKEPLKKVPWKHSRDGMKGMNQFVYRHVFENKKSTWDRPALFNLKKLKVTFVRKTTKNSDELVIYMPEKYFFKYELDEAVPILTQYVWQAWKWFQSNFKAHLAIPMEYREMEFAHEIFDPALRQWVQENGMAKVKTKRGYGIVDESKIGFPEKEFTTIEQVKADLESGDRILDLEEKVSILLDSMTKLTKTVTEISASMTETTKTVKVLAESMQEFMGTRRKMEKRLDNENNNMFS